jgi:hypothetical protein
VDARGRLAALLAAPETDWKPKALDWRPVLDAAGVDAASLRPTSPRIVPAAPFDTRAAWTGVYTQGRTPLRIEAASWKGTPVFFAVSAVDDRPEPGVGFGDASAERFMFILQLVVMTAAVLLAIRNVRTRRGDRQGAIRAALAVFIIGAAQAFFTAAARAGAMATGNDFAHLFGDATTVALYVLVAYLAIEPYARRRWPELLISWARLVAGRVRDPLVARHVLIGIIGGLGHALLSAASRPFASAMDGAPEDSAHLVMGNLWDALWSLPAGAIFGILNGTMMIVALVIFTMILRKRVLAGAAIFIMAVTYLTMSVAQRPWSIPFYVLIAALLAFILLRYGVVALCVTQGSFFAFLLSPLLPGSSWATATAPLTLAVVIALALWAFHTSLGGQKMFSASLLDE